MKAEAIVYTSCTGNTRRYAYMLGKAANLQHPMYIDGQFVTWRGDAWIDVVNPATEAVISRIPDGQAEDAQIGRAHV